MIPPEIADHVAEIQDICREFSIQPLDLIGSATTVGFDPAFSDADFLVTYADDYDWGPWARRLWEFQAKLSSALDRDVDVLMNHRGMNPGLQSTIELQRVEIYRDSGFQKTS